MLLSTKGRICRPGGLRSTRRLPAQKMMVEDGPTGGNSCSCAPRGVTPAAGRATRNRSVPTNCGYCATRPPDRDEWRLGHLDCGLRASRPRGRDEWRLGHLDCGFRASRRSDRGEWRVMHASTARKSLGADTRTGEHGCSHRKHSSRRRGPRSHRRLIHEVSSRTFLGDRPGLAS